MPSTQTERGSAAQVVFDKLRADAAVQDKVAEVEKLCNACRQWAKYPLVKGKYNRPSVPYPIPSELLICRLPALRVPVPTLPLPLDPTMRYDNCVCVDSFEKQFETAGGMNLPKISSCKGSNGKTYKQLVRQTTSSTCFLFVHYQQFKGNDDLRQDAVMEQVFDVVNAVLRRDRQTKRRELGVRGYKVIPLDSQTGLLEFVTNTTPLRGWLNAGHRRCVHARKHFHTLIFVSYWPKDMGPEDVRQRHTKAWDTYKTDADRDKLLKVYHEIRSKVKPVMRHYFAEKNKSPVTWFAMRLKYTRSVATTSIVGHILGLGDRHTSNILLDSSTGEVVHIDLGIAFDQVSI
jgi:ataxia telangiectasia mutated family protein